MILTGAQIKARVAEPADGFSIEPFVAEAVQPASYDFHLGDRFLRFVRPCFVNPRHEGQPIDACGEGDALEVGQDNGIILGPDNFCLALTFEHFAFPPDLGAKVYTKSSWGRLGLSVANDAGWIDPGFRGRIVLELHNRNPKARLVIHAGTPIGQLVFEQVAATPDADAYRGNYQDQTDFAVDRWRASLAKGYRRALAVRGDAR